MSDSCPLLHRRFAAGRWLVMAGWAAWAWGAPAADGQFTIKVVDDATGQPLACRMHVLNSAKRPVKPPKAAFFHDHFASDGQTTLKLNRGQYALEIERGLEYLNVTGRFTIDPFADDERTIRLKRFANLAEQGWWSGDLDIARPLDQLEQLMAADDLHVAPLVSMQNDRSQWTKIAPPAEPLRAAPDQRWIHVLGASDIRAAGSVRMLNLEGRFAVPPAKRLDPPTTALLAEVRRQAGAWIDVSHASSWDFPIWVALGLVDSVELANDQMRRGETGPDELGCRPRDRTLYPGPSGPGRWNSFIYYQLLNCGLRLPPSAGSGSGRVGNPIGYNRMYAHIDGPPNYERWWQSVRDGRVVVTNGPLLTPTVEGEPPGHQFAADEGAEIELEVGVTLSTRDRVEYLEIVRDGRVVYNARLDEWAKQGGQLPKQRFDRSGWFLLRAVASNEQTYRFASTAPYYVQIGERSRVSAAAAQFFVDWTAERSRQLAERQPTLSQVDAERYEAARQFWQALRDRANAD